MGGCQSCHKFTPLSSRRYFDLPLLVMTREHHKNCDKKLHFLAENVKWGTMNVFKGMTLRWGQAWFKKIWSSDSDAGGITSSHILSLQPKQNWKNCAAIISSPWWRILDEAPSLWLLLMFINLCPLIQCPQSMIQDNQVIYWWWQKCRNSLLKISPPQYKRELVLWTIIIWAAFLTGDSWLCSGKFQWFSSSSFS